MSQPYPLDQLEVIGYSEVPDLSLSLPRLLSAIFAVKDTSEVLFPSYRLSSNDVIDPTLSSRDEFDELVLSEEVSSYERVSALSDHELWLDDVGQVHYTRGSEAQRKLKELCDTHCLRAKEELNRANLEAARNHAMIAYSANPNRVEPLLYRAASEMRMINESQNSQNACEELRLTEFIASDHLPVESFKIAYQGLIPPIAAIFSDTAPASACKFVNIATRRPVPFSLA